MHGPLNLINMVNLWRDIRSPDAVPRKISYRATTPLYAGEKYRAILSDEKEKITDIKLVDSYGKTAMVGTIESA